jgi:perosamine synthetase
MNSESEGTINGAWMPTVVFAPELGIDREALQSTFASNHIDARVFFWPLSSISAFKPQPQNKFAWSIPHRAINLPSYHDLSKNDQDDVIKIILSLVHN